jgi:hypothetical protein
MDKELDEFQEKAVTFAVISTQNSSMNEGRDFKKLEKGRRYK